MMIIFHGCLLSSYASANRISSIVSALACLIVKLDPALFDYSLTTPKNLGSLCRKV
jgi:hypothetical protein